MLIPLVLPSILPNQVFIFYLNLIEHNQNNQKTQKLVCKITKPGSLPNDSIELPRKIRQLTLVLINPLVLQVQGLCAVQNRN